MEGFFVRLALSDNIKPRLARHFLFWFVAWAFQGIIYGFLYGGSRDAGIFVVSFTEALFFLPQHLLLSYSIVYFILPRYLLKGAYWSGMMGIVLLIILAAMLSPVVWILVVRPFRGFIDFPYEQKTIFYSFMGGLRGSMTVAGFAVAIKLLKYWFVKKTENEFLERERLRTELELLKRQLDPHFMFNTLNSIYSMALKNSPQTAPAILQLSSLMRYMISEGKGQTIPLNNEIQIIRDYMDLEKGRLGDRLDQSMNISGHLEEKKIAPLLLLPFVENSFKHGAYGMSEQAWLSLDIQILGDELRFKLINGRPVDKNEQVSGIGLQNVRKRLGLLYPEGHDLRITESSDTFVVSLTLMLNKIAVA